MIPQIRSPGHQTSRNGGLVTLLLPFTPVFFFTELLLLVQHAHLPIAAVFITAVTIRSTFFLRSCRLYIRIKYLSSRCYCRPSVNFFDFLLLQYQRHGTRYCRWNRHVSLLTEAIDMCWRILDDGEILVDAYKMTLMCGRFYLAALISIPHWDHSKRSSPRSH